jgi:hypothetical protein
MMPQKYLHPGIAVAILLILTAVVVRGSEQTCERVCSLLRWITSWPEPPAPAS